MNEFKRILVVAGTRPEAIKLAPLIGGLLRSPVALRLCVTAQHRELADDAFRFFSITPDFDLDLMRDGQDLTGFFAAAVTGLRDVIAAWRPDLMLVQGDTATTFAATVAGFYARVPVGHVEAGLRTGDLARPFPEEMHRRMIAGMATLHFAPTEAARDALVSEGVADERVWITGNTGIDALHVALGHLEANGAVQGELAAHFSFLDPARQLILVTTHRRENHGAPLAEIAGAVALLAATENVEIVMPVHPSPHVGLLLAEQLGNLPNVYLCPPLDYVAFLYLLRRARLVMTDSGGVQEEAPALGCPVLVLRDVTERQEGVTTGAARIVGTEAGAIVEAARELLRNDALHAAMAQPSSPYGDGRATQRIINEILRFLGKA